MISGRVETTTEEGSRIAEEGDVIHVRRGSAYSFEVPEDAPSTRYAVVRSTSRLEDYVAQHGAADNWRG